MKNYIITNYFLKTKNLNIYIYKTIIMEYKILDHFE